MSWRVSIRVGLIASLLAISFSIPASGQRRLPASAVSIRSGFGGGFPPINTAVPPASVLSFRPFGFNQPFVPFHGGSRFFRHKRFHRGSYGGVGYGYAYAVPYPVAVTSDGQYVDAD